MRHSNFCQFTWVSKTRYTLFHFVLMGMTMLSMIYGRFALAQQTDAPSQPFVLGQIIERELSAGQAHTYHVNLTTGQYFKAVAEHRGLEIFLRVYDPAGKQRGEFDLELRKDGRETAELVAEVEGVYRLEIRSKLKNAPAGRYTLNFAELRVAQEPDRVLQEARNLFSEGKAAFSRAALSEAVKRMQDSLPLFEKTLGENHLETALVINRLGYTTLVADRGRDKAEELIRKALRIREQLTGADEAEAADSLTYLGVAHTRKGLYEEGERLLTRSLSIKERTIGTDHPETAHTLYQLGVHYILWAKPGAAEQVAERLLTVRKNAFGAEHREVAAAYVLLGNITSDKGDYDKAVNYHQQAQLIYEKVSGPEHGDVAACQHNLAHVYIIRGELEKAWQAEEIALRLFEKNYGAEHLNTARAIHGMGDVLRLRGDYNKAIVLIERSLEIKKKLAGPVTPLVASGLHMLADIYVAKGESHKALSLYQNALEIFEKTVGPNQYYVAAPLIGMGTLHLKQGRFAQAESLLQRALSVREKNLGVDHSAVSEPLRELAILQHRRGQSTLADSLFQRAVSVTTNSLGEHHPELTTTLTEWSALHEARGKVDQAVETLARAIANSEYTISLQLVFGSEHQKRSYLATMSAEVDRAVSLHLRAAPGHAAARDQAASIVLQRKGRVLTASINELSLLRRNLSPEEQGLLDRLQTARAQLARLALNETPTQRLDEYRAQVRQREAQIEMLESDISRRSARYRIQSQPVTLAAVQAAVPSNAALLEYIVWRPYDPRAPHTDQAWGAPRYAAYVLRQQGEAQFVDLGEAAPIEQAIAAWRQALRDASRPNVKTLARVVDQKIMQPVRARLGAASQLLVAPDGVLNLIPFAALVDEQQRYLLERFSFSYLASGRDLLRREHQPAGSSLPLIVANPDFGWDTAPAAQATRNDVQPKQQERAYFLPITGTAREAKALQAILPQAQVLTGAQATETALKQVNGPSILHIATHGFFLPEQSTDTVEQGVRQKIALRSGLPASLGGQLENPLLRSGLGLAGANLGGNGDDDGILTALEVAGLNLWGTKLVVLSACDTGVGEIKRGEGVYGLRRALALAGAETQVMSLWPISDFATRELMTAYYLGLQKGNSREMSLRQAQLEMLRKPERRHPFYWASFVQAGEWRPLNNPH